MTTNVEMNYYNGSGYEVIYPKVGIGMETGQFKGTGVLQASFTLQNKPSIIFLFSSNGIMAIFNMENGGIYYNFTKHSTSTIGHTKWAGILLEHFYGISYNSTTKQFTFSSLGEYVAQFPLTASSYEIKWEQNLLNSTYDTIKYVSIY